MNERGHDGLEKFPDFDVTTNGQPPVPYPAQISSNGYALPADRWSGRKENGGNGLLKQWTAWDQPSQKAGHSRQKSLSEAIRTMRTRHGSVSQNAHELADALKAPVSPKLIVMTSPGGNPRPSHGMDCSC